MGAGKPVCRSGQPLRPVRIASSGQPGASDRPGVKYVNPVLINHKRSINYRSYLLFDGVFIIDAVVGNLI